jgi:hypothetical protein
MLKKKNIFATKKKQKGMAVIEAIPVLFLLVLIFNFSLGFFGAIHTGVLNSIGSYNYAFETFRYRSNLMYFRPGVDVKNYKNSMSRVHGIIKDGSEASPNEEKGVWPATVRDVSFSYIKGDAKRGLAGAESNPMDRGYAGRTNNKNVWFATSESVPTATALQSPSIWIKTVYGICINADCSTDGQKNRVGE